MISGKDVYEVVSALVPLYVAMFLAYGSVRWWGVFTPVQCAGINRYVAMFAVPFLSFSVITSTNLFALNGKFIIADTLQKAAILLGLAVWSLVVSAKANIVGGGESGGGGLEWAITLFSISTLPNTLIIGIPLLRAMYGDSAADLMVQVIVFQGGVWYNFLLILFEYRAAKILINERFPGSTREIESIKVDHDVVSLGGIDALETDAERDTDGRIHVRVRRSSFSSSSFNNYSFRLSPMMPRASDLSGVEIYSVQSSSPRSVHSSFNYSGREVVSGVPINHEISIPITTHPIISYSAGDLRTGGNSSHLFDLQMQSFHSTGHGRNYSIEKCEENRSDHGGGLGGSRKVVDGGGEGALESQKKPQEMPPATVMTKLILLMVWRKIIRNPNTYASLFGVAWSLVSNKWHLKMPLIIDGSISIISKTGLGMAVFSLGLFTAMHPKIIACGKAMAGMSMAMKFLLGPAVMAVTSLAVGIRGKLLHVAIIQAALPLGVVPFVFAKEYDLHADIISTSVIFGMLIALPITILYNVLLEL